MTKDKLKKIPHIFSGMMILLHSLDRFDAGQKASFVFLFAGIIFLSVAIFHKILVQRFPLIDITFYSIESILSFIIAFEYWSIGKNALPFAYILAGIFQIVTIFIFLRKFKKSRQ